MDLLINLSLIIVPVTSPGSSVRPRALGLNLSRILNSKWEKGMTTMPAAMRLEGVARDELEKLFVCRHQNMHQDYQNGQLVPI